MESVGVLGVYGYRLWRRRPPAAFAFFAGLRTIGRHGSASRRGSGSTVVRTVAFCKRVAQQVGEDNLLVWASALAYSWLFAIFPFLIVLMSLVGHLPRATRRSARHTVDDFFAHSLPTSAKSAVMDNVDAIMHQTRHSGLLSVGLVVTLWSASSGMAMTMYALDQCYDLKRGRPFYKQRPLAVALTVAVAVMVLAVFLLLPLAPRSRGGWSTAGRWRGRRLSCWRWCGTRPPAC